MKNRSFLACLLVLILTVISSVAASIPPATGIPVRLAENTNALLPIVIGDKASERTKKDAVTLADYLQQMSGATFTVKAGDGAAGIVIGVPADFTKLPLQPGFPGGPFGREEYLLQSRKGGLWLLGATDLAVDHAIWDLLYHFGYRQFFPGKAWEIVPTLGKLAISVNVREKPAYISRRIWYDWGMQDYNTQPYADWCARNRMVQGFQLNSGHAYEEIVRRNKATFDAHPEYFSLVNGKRLTNGEDKFCIANPDLRKLVVDWAVSGIKANPSLDSISMEPSDGDNWCECDNCKKMGSISDRALTLANEVAVAINQLGLGDKYVGMYAYNRHCPPPTIPVDPHVIISATTAFITGGFTFDQVVEGWRAKGATLGVYDYYSVSIWDWNMPGRATATHPDYVASSIRKFYAQGARFLDCQAGDCWGPCGLGYYVASRVMWDLKQADHVKEITEDFLTCAFGPAKEPMRGYYQLITGDASHRPGSDMVGRMYRYLAEAKKLAAGRQDILMRLYQLVAYTRYAELNYNMTAPGADKEAKFRWLTFAYRMRKTSMVHYYGVWSDAIGQRSALAPKHPLKDETLFTQQELDTILTEGIANNTPVEMGFTPVSFSKNLVAADRLKLPDVPLGAVPAFPQDHHYYYLWVEKAPADYTLKVTVQRVWNLRPHHVKLFAVKDATTETLVSDNDTVRPDGKTYDVVLHMPNAGLYGVEVLDGGDYTRIVWPDGLPVALPSAEDTPTISSMFRGRWTLYCYVPKGTKVVGGWFQERAGTLRDADGNVVIDFSKIENGWFSAPVQKGQDGRLWKFDFNAGIRQLMTIPPYLFRSNKDILLPKEVIGKDAK